MREMGGLRKPMPTTFLTYVIGSLALAGIAPLSGFWSKDELLVAANSERPWLFVVLLVGGGCSRPSTRTRWCS